MKKPSDKITQLILNYNINNNQDGVELAIESWKEDCENNSYHNSEQQMVQGLFDDFESGWNNDNDRADDFFDELGCSKYIVRAIEDLYKYWEWEFGSRLYKDTLEEKLDLVYYFEAKELMMKAIEEEELDIEYWG